MVSTQRICIVTAAMGLAATLSLFVTQQQAASTIGQIASAIKTFGMKVTIRELIGAGTLTDLLAVAGAYSAAYYVGGAIGNLIVATFIGSAAMLGATGIGRSR